MHGNTTGERDEEDLKRNCLTIRWPDAQHKAVVDTAWRRRTSASEMIREMVLDRLRADGVKVEDSWPQDVSDSPARSSKAGRATRGAFGKVGGIA